MGCVSCKSIDPARAPSSLPTAAESVILSPAKPSGATLPLPPPYHKRKSLATARVHIGQADQVFDKYDVLDEILGTGVSGVVRVCRERSTGTMFAMKTLSLQNMSAKRCAMLHNEVDIYLKLDHPNIAKLVEVFEDSKQIFLVMELCTGGELYERLAVKKRYCEADTIAVTIQMLEAINYCHAHHICHRDLKLENWVYDSPDEDAQLKLIDFGFSRSFSPLIPMTAMHGTVYYVSPEVMDGCYREKCDVWSIGVIVFMLLSGSPPFNGTQDYEILNRIRNIDYGFDAPVWSAVSDEAKDFISLILVKDPAERPSAQEALAHPWLQQVNRADFASKEISLDVLKSMRDFSKASALKRIAMGMTAYFLSSTEVKDLQKEFRKLDVDKSGVITMQEFVRVITASKLHVSMSEAQEIFKRLDHDGDLEVQYTSFLASALHAKLDDDRWLKEAFEMLDNDGEGLITERDLREILGNSFGDVPVEAIIGDKEGIDFETFRQLMKMTEPDDTDTQRSQCAEDDNSTTAPNKGGAALSSSAAS